MPTICSICFTMYDETHDCPFKEAGSNSASVDDYAAKVALLDMFKDHYWDSLEKERDLILKHVESVLDMYEF